MPPVCKARVGDFLAISAPVGKVLKQVFSGSKSNARPGEEGGGLH